MGAIRTIAANTDAALAPRKLTCADAVMLAAADAFGPSGRPELIGEEVFVLPPEGFLHFDAAYALQSWLLAHVSPLGLMVRIREPVHIDDTTVLIPDLSVFPAGTTARHMTAERALLIIEVADTTEARDRKLKLPVYAAAGVADLWLVQAQHRAVIVHREPMDGDWMSVQRVLVSQSIAPLCTPKAAFPVAALPEPGTDDEDRPAS